MELISGVLCACAVSALVYKYFVGERRGSNAPGPRPLPVLGNVHQLDRRSIHFTLTEWARRYGPVLQFRVMWTPYVVLSSPDAIHEALVTRSGDFASRPYIYRAQVVNAGQQDIGTQPFTPLLRVMKKEAQKAIKAYGTGLERIESITLSSVEELVETCSALEKQGAVDLKPELYRTIINTLCVLIFGRHVSRDEDLVDRVIELDQTVAASFSNTPAAMLLDVFPLSRYLGNQKMWQTILRTVSVSEKFWEDFVLPHRAEWLEEGGTWERGVADAMFAAQRDTEVTDVNQNPTHAQTPRMSDDNVRLALQNLVVAGSVTTTNSLYAFINILLHHQDVQKRIQKEVVEVLGAKNVTLADKAHMHYTRAALFELLRYMTVNPLAIPHMTTVDTSVQGVNIKANTVCLMNLWAAHHSEEYWSEPFVFRPERFLTSDGTLVTPDHPSRKRLFAFGAGVRVCMGETLALNRLFLIIATLLHKFDFLPPEDALSVPCDPREYTFSVLLNPLPYKVQIRTRKS